MAKGKSKKGKDKGNGKDTKGKFGKDKGKPAASAGKGKGGHKSANKDLKDVECFYCKKKGHLRRDCRKYLADHGKSVNEVGPEEIPPNMQSVEASGSEWVWSLEAEAAAAAAPSPARRRISRKKRCAIRALEEMRRRIRTTPMRRRARKRKPLSGRPNGRLPSRVLVQLAKRYFEQLPGANREEIYLRRFGPGAR